jgi:putative flavoprotein involved in K+ transport
VVTRVKRSRVATADSVHARFITHVEAHHDCPELLSLPALWVGLRLAPAVRSPVCLQGGVVITERYQVIVVGAGQAGLSVAYHLARNDQDFLVLDAGDSIGDSWRSRWDSLRLFTPARYSGLPGLPFPAAPYHLPTKDEVADYLEAYVERFELPVRLGTRVKALRRDGPLFALETQDRRYEAESVVVATGAFGRPRVPSFAGSLARSIVQLHSSAYRNPAQLPEGDVLVVGAGNSGAQIAIELAESRPVWLSGRDVGRIPRRLLGRDVYDWLWPTVMRPTTDSWLGRRIRERRFAAADPLVGIAARELALPRLERVGRTVGVRDGRPLLDDGRAPDVRAVVWCTGFRPDFRWIELPVFDRDGYPRHRQGVVAAAPGLYFVGLRFLSRLNSSLIGGVGADAARVVGDITRRAAREAV